MKVLNTLIQTKKVSIVNHNLKGNFQMQPIYTKQLEKLSNTEYVVSITFAVFSTPEHPFPIDLSATISGNFTFEASVPDIEAENFMAGPAIQILYPHLRSVVASLTATCYLQPLLLPLVDPRIFKDV
ncbi:MAG TPA: hypothetical protein VK005_00630 [Acholeplasma sp.]|nr:hypothetical protein [Acholeplasma sp.]